MLCQQNVKTRYFTRSSQSIKFGKSDLIDIDYIDQSVEIDDTLDSFVDLYRSYRFHRFVSEDVCSSVHLKMKTDFTQPPNLLTIELPLRVGPTIYYHLKKKV